jgi:hypothetical protein
MYAAAKSFFQCFGVLCQFFDKFETNMEEEKRKGKNKMVIGSAAFMFIYLDSSS